MITKESPYKITVAFLHQAITWPGITGGEKTLSEARIPGIKMRMVNIECEDGSTLKGLLCKAKNRETLIIEANIANLLIERVETVKSKVA